MASSNLSNTKKFSNRSVWYIDGILTGIATPGQSGLESNVNEELYCCIAT